jgi:hypothetical protein
MNRELMEEQDWAYNESLRIDREREEQFLREAYAIPQVKANVEPKEEAKEETKEDPKLTLFQLRNARIQFYEKKIDLKN